MKNAYLTHREFGYGRLRSLCWAIAYAAQSTFRSLFRRGLSDGELRVLLVNLHHSLERSILNSERRLMNDLDNLAARFTALEAAAKLANDKAVVLEQNSDKLISLVADLRASIPIASTPADVQALLDRIDTVTAGLGTVATGLDAEATSEAAALATPAGTASASTLSGS